MLFYSGPPIQPITMNDKSRPKRERLRLLRFLPRDIQTNIIVKMTIATTTICHHGALHPSVSSVCEKRMLQCSAGRNAVLRLVDEHLLQQVDRGSVCTRHSIEFSNVVEQISRIVPHPDDKIWEAQGFSCNLTYMRPTIWVYVYISL